MIAVKTNGTYVRNVTFHTYITNYINFTDNYNIHINLKKIKYLQISLIPTKINANSSTINICKLVANIRPDTHEICLKNTNYTNVSNVTMLQMGQMSLAITKKPGVSISREFFLMKLNLLHKNKHLQTSCNLRDKKNLLGGF